uniref:Uncharacterized protein n=1 Tax=Zea mays TaxID=4577 RepID=C4J0N9_MAIZE|nr:unknown [Zea mays]
MDTAPLISPAHHITICCLNVIFSNGDFFVRLDKNDNGKTNAALPTRTNPSKIELMPMDLPGLSLANSHFSMSRASIPTYRKRKVSAMKDKVAKACLVVTLELSVTLCQV